MKITQVTAPILLLATIVVACGAPFTRPAQPLSSPLQVTPAIVERPPVPVQKYEPFLLTSAELAAAARGIAASGMQPDQVYVYRVARLQNAYRFNLGQMYAGVPLAAGEYGSSIPGVAVIVPDDANAPAVRDSFGLSYTIYSLDTQPAFAPEAAIRLLVGNLQIKGNVSITPTTRLEIHAYPNPTAKWNLPTNSANPTEVFRLVYKITFAAQCPEWVRAVWMDAHTGEVLQLGYDLEYLQRTAQGMPTVVPGACTVRPPTTPIPASTRLPTYTPRPVQIITPTP